MSSFLGGFAEGLKGLPGAIGGIREAHDEDEQLKKEAEAYYTYYRDELPPDTRERWAAMKGKEKMDAIKAFRFKSDMDYRKNKERIEGRRFDMEERDRAVSADINKIRLKNLTNPPPAQQPKIINLNPQGGGSPVPVLVNPKGGAQLVPQPTAAKEAPASFKSVDLNRNVWVDQYNREHILNDAQRKAFEASEASRAAGATGTNIPGVPDINQQLAEEQGKLASGRSGRYTLFPGVTVGTPRTDVISGLEAKRAALMKLYGNQSPAPAGPPAGLTPTPSPTPTATPGPVAGETPPGKVRVIGPGGQSGMIPAEQLPIYIKQGWRQAGAAPAAAAGADLYGGMDGLMA